MPSDVAPDVQSVAQAPSGAGAAQGRNDLRMGRASGPLFWMVETSQGKVRGIANGAIKQFKGVPYGVPTSGDWRWRAPRRARPWAGVRTCYGYGQVSPQVPMDLTFDYATLINWDSHIGPGGMGEDCLNLNIWTPALDGSALRPVLVALHGGGWLTGSGNGPMYDGAQLARRGDAVVVTVNHRLGVLGGAGFAALGLGHPFEDAGVCGVMDLVAALEWIRDNIEAFGGDPRCVTIFGQSGGGSKVLTLMGTAAAQGLFHRAVAQSPPAIGAWAPEEGAAQARRLLDELEISPRTPTKLLDLPWERLLEAQAAVGDFRPVAGCDFLPEAPFAKAAPDISAMIPLVLSTTLHDHSLRFENYDVTAAELSGIFAAQWGAGGEAILRAYEAERRPEPPFLLQGRAWTDIYRAQILRFAALRAAQADSTTYVYEWDWATSAYDGRWGAFHAEDLDASFHLYRSPACGSGTAEGRLMCDRMVESLVAFARHGVPENDLMPPWPAYDLARKATMVFDTQMRVVDDYRGEFLRLVGPPAP